MALASSFNACHKICKFRFAKIPDTLLQPAILDFFNVGTFVLRNVLQKQRVQTTSGPLASSYWGMEECKRNGNHSILLEGGAVIYKCCLKGNHS